MKGKKKEKNVEEGVHGVGLGEVRRHQVFVGILPIFICGAESRISLMLDGAMWRVSYRDGDTEVRKGEEAGWGGGGMEEARLQMGK